MFNLDKVSPTRYVIFNRERGFARHVSNYDELFKELSIKYPNVTFEKGITYNRVIESIKYFNQIKMLVGVHGSQFSNVIFMQPNTYYIEIQMESEKFLMMRIAVFTGKKVILVKDGNIKYREIVDNLVNTKVVIEGIDYAFSDIASGDKFFSFG
ncbi:hypothetical protein TVAG_224090 [Trichomonas vaginalis G3]|uniref:Glycosyltransferase 61 catalytic domain-containing protein n=1 Tax=Trichomonas vaginalis (strain ATCC PRA-98 / G3) TaxID=412133 RepID=A2DW32_TRIV3|nr:glycosyltransferase family [Trichomonas vaginalis G3]EAY15333.1 hypothetical protein TVAG_224090 [Trichomonas vaginalis G3]KAI5496804.1 glycosyltransferase family [Trichomonas vaginalis G3]|eukprot:XP_001327556.1 hypothetical protein [Trichomonas vaginalis G3]